MMDHGFEIFPDVFQRFELPRVDALPEVEPAARSRAGARHLMGVPTIREFAFDPRLIEIAGAVLQTKPMPFRATLFDKSSHANWLVVWHQDTALPLRHRVGAKGWGPWSVKSGVIYAHAPAEALSQVVALRVHLDDSTSTNGPLRVLPGTHALGLLSDEQVIQLSRERDPVDCLSPVGGVVAMRPLLVHASSKASDGHRRRVLHIEYASQLAFPGGIEVAVA